MPLCYILAKKRDEGSPPYVSDELRAEGPVDTRTVPELVYDSLPYRQDKKAKYYRGKKAPEVRTWGHVCAILTGEYQFMLKFRYKYLADVAVAVLQNGEKFERHVSQTLTMLQYPSFPDGKGIDEDDVEPHTLFGDESPSGFVFIRDLMGNGLGGSAAIQEELKSLCPQLKCIDIFGPYDYVVEFPVGDIAAYTRTFKSIEKAIKPRALRYMDLFSEPFPRNPPPGAGNAPTGN